MKYQLLFCFFLICVSQIFAQVEKSEVNYEKLFDGLKNWAELVKTFNKDKIQIFSGYIQLTEEDFLKSYLPSKNFTRDFHYYFVRNNKLEGQGPLIIWLNGGPGCSSLDGAFAENGPFFLEDYYTKPVRAKVNKYSWSEFSQTLFLETPAGVGFSKRKDSYVQNDYSVSLDNTAFIRKFLDENPDIEYIDKIKKIKREIFIAGESYAGIYVPYFAYSIHNFNENPLNRQINLKGFAVGNACTDMDKQCSELYGIQDITYMYESGLLRKELYVQYQAKCQCGYNNIEQIKDYCPTCFEIIDEIMVQIKMNYKYADSTTTPEPPYINNYDTQRTCPTYTFYDTDFGAPCIDTKPMTTFLNKRNVKEALNVDPSIKWYLCTNSGRNGLDFQRSDNGSYWIYPILWRTGKYRMLVFSGNTDMSVPITGSRAWIRDFVKENNVPLYQPYTNWYMKDDKTKIKQVVGNVEKYENFDFISIHGVGHMVPQWQRQGSLKMMKYFVQNKDILSDDE